MATARKLPSGSYRVQVFAGYGKNGKRIYKSFTAPTKQEAEFAAAYFSTHRREVRTDGRNRTLSEAIDQYIQVKDNLLSPTTLEGYRKIQRNRFPTLMQTKLCNITNELLQEAVNEEVKTPCKNKKGQTLSPKSIQNAYGLIVSVLNKYYPDLNTDVVLPTKPPVFKELLEPDVIFKVVRGSSIELPVLLAMWLSFSMSEIRGLTKSQSLDGEYLTIREVVVDVEGESVTKQNAKNPYRNRRHKIPPYIQKLIEATDPAEDRLVPLSGNVIYKRWSRLLERNHLPHMSFHDLRHVNASVMALLRIPDKYAQERGGWKTDNVMKKVYQHTFSAEREAVDALIDAYFADKLEE